MGAAVEETDANGNSVRGSQANDTNTGEGVEGSAGAEVDDTENDLDNHAEHHGVQGNVQLGVDLLPPAGTRDGTVTSESPGATRGGGCATNAAKDGQNNKGEEKSKGTARGSHGILDDGGDGLTGSQVDQVGDVGEYENEGDEEQETGQGVEADGKDESLGDLSSGLLDLLAHGDNHASGRSGVSGVKETDAERPSIGPSGVGLEVGEDVFGIVTAVLGNNENGDDEGEDTSKCPENSGGLSHEKFSTLSFHTNQTTPSTREQNHSYIKDGQPLVAERGHNVANEGQTQEDEENLVRLAGKDADTRFRLENVDACDDEQSSSKVHGQGDGNVSHDVQPAANPAGHAAVLGRGQHESLVVDTYRAEVVSIKSGFGECRSRPAASTANMTGEKSW